MMKMNNTKLINLNDVLRHINKFIKIDDNQIYRRVRIKLHRQGMVLRDELEGYEIKTKNQQVCKAGQFLVAEIDAKVGGYGIVPQELDGAIVSSHYFLFDIDSNKVDLKYFEAITKTDYFFSQIKAEGSTNYASIRPKDVLALQIPLPSVNEQIKLATNINRIFNFRKDIASITNSNMKYISSLRQQILQEAVQGKLVPQNPNDEPASELLKKIKAEKDKLIREGKLKKQKPLAPISQDEIPYELPKGWEWVRLGEICWVNPRNHLEDRLEVAFIPMNLIQDNAQNKHGQEIRKWKDIKSGFTHFAEDDIVFAKITPCFQNRNSAILNNLKNKYGAGTTELYVIRSYNNLTLPKFMFFLVNTKKFIDDGVSTYKGTAGQQRIKREFVENYILGLPPLPEQTRIVEKVDKLMAYCDELEKQVKENQINFEKLMGAVLKESFKDGK